MLPSWNVAQVSSAARLLQRSMEDQVSGHCLNRLPRPAQHSSVVRDAERWQLRLAVAGTAASTQLGHAKACSKLALST